MPLAFFIVPIPLPFDPAQACYLESYRCSDAICRRASWQPRIREASRYFASFPDEPPAASANNLRAYSRSATGCPMRSSPLTAQTMRLTASKTYSLPPEYRHQAGAPSTGSVLPAVTRYTPRLAETSARPSPRRQMSRDSASAVSVRSVRNSFPPALQITRLSPTIAANPPAFHETACSWPSMRAIGKEDAEVWKARNPVVLASHSVTRGSGAPELCSEAARAAGKRSVRTHPEGPNSKTPPAEVAMSVAEPSARIPVA